MCSFPIPCLFLDTHLSVVAHRLPAVAEGFSVPSTTVHCSAVSHRHSAKEKCLQSERPPCLSLLSILSQQEKTKQPFRDRTSPTMLLFGISPCLSVQTTEPVPSQCQALSLQLRYGFWWGSGELPMPSKSNHKLRRESFTRRQEEGKET